MQIGGMQSLRRAMRRRHQHTYFREGDPGIMAKLAALMDQGAFHVAQVGASMTSLVLCNDFVNGLDDGLGVPIRSEEHTSELQSLMRISYAVFFLKKNKN